MSEPLVSVVLAIDSVATGEETIDALAAQTIAGRVEVVLVGPGLVVPPDRWSGLAGVTVVEADIRALASARAAGVLAASAPYVFIAETHGFPAATCLERLVAVAQAGADAVLPRFVNANPKTARSWASLFATYAAYTGPEGCDLRSVSLHNALFRRGPLVEVALREPLDLVYGVGLSAMFRDQRRRMRYEPEAILHHLNVSRPMSIVTDRFISSWLWAGMRRRRLSGLARAAHLVATPLVPLLFLGSVLRSDGWRALKPQMPRGTLSVLAVATLPVAAGEALGYATGAGDAERRHVDLELHRREHI